jgi:signal transduction histidine kinase
LLLQSYFLFYNPSQSVPRAVDVLLQRRGDEASLIIEDDGIGFDPATSAPGNNGLGLAGMRERAALVGGVVIIETAPGKGLTVFVRIPTAPSPRKKG